MQPGAVSYNLLNYWKLDQIVSTSRESTQPKRFVRWYREVQMELNR